MSIADTLDARMRAPQVPPPGIPSHPQHALSHKRRTRLFTHLWQLADEGAPMVANNELKRIVGATGKIGDALAALIKAGLIEIGYSPDGQRRVTIVATGRHTGFQKPQEWWGWQKGRPPKTKPAASLQDRPVTAFKRPSGTIAYGYSDSFLYGHLADAVRECRRRGDVVYRDPRNPLVVLINGKAGDVLARAAWHRRMRT
jgi:hypothetical protein